MTRSGSSVSEGGSCIWDSNLICFTPVVHGSRVGMVMMKRGKARDKMITQR